MLQKMGAAMVTAVLCMGLGLSAATAQTPDQDRKHRARQDCIQSGGWYHPDNDVCEYESSAKAILTDNERKACERNGGWFRTDNGVCEMGSKDPRGWSNPR